jgi:putative modified peptide
MPNKISPKVVDTLLDKLSSDDDFRTRFQADPRAALASLGDEDARNAPPGAKGPWACCAVTKLASKEQIAASRDELAKQLTAESMFTPFKLEA